MVIDYALEKDREGGAGFAAEEFLDSLGKEKWESLEAVLWRSGAGEGDLWKRSVSNASLRFLFSLLTQIVGVVCFSPRSMIPRLEKLETEEGIWTFWD